MKKLCRDWRIYATLALFAVSYLVYSCSRPTEVEREREISCSTRAIFSLISENVRSTLSSTDGDYFIGWYRVPERDGNPIPMIDSTAYYSDYEVGGRTYITAINDGDRWNASVVLPDETTNDWTDIVFHAEYEGETDCFVNLFPYWVVCGTRDIYVTYLRAALCDCYGMWHMSFYKNDEKYYEGKFTVLPRLEPGTVPCGQTYNQGSYPNDPYDSICYLIEDPDDEFLCTGAPDEIQYMISSKGCALLSAVIVLAYHDVNVNPVDLNAWLIDHGGYGKKGGIYFPKVAEYVKNETDKEIEYLGKFNDCDWNYLRDLICWYGPQVIVVPHHYVVATGMDDEESTFLITDPDEGIETTLAERYSNSCYGIRAFHGPDYFCSPEMFVVSLYSPAEMLITSPSGKKTGYDPISGETFQDIPNSSYGLNWLYDAETELADPTWKELEVMKPEIGDYTIQIIGTDEGTYSFEMLGYNELGESSSYLSADIPIYYGAIHQYSIQYGEDTEAIFKIEGGYDGDSQRKWDVNQLLSYFTIASKTVRLPSGIMQYALGITYHEDIDAGSFTATLNDIDISDMFNPVPDSSEIVTIDLSQGSNRLVLTIEGDVPSRRNIDTDKFEIIATP